jgi:hypothetical protein
MATIRNKDYTSTVIKRKRLSIICSKFKLRLCLCNALACYEPDMHNSQHMPKFV